MDPIPWQTLIDAGPLYFVIGVLVFLLIRAYAVTDKLRDTMGATLDKSVSAIDMLNVAIQANTEIGKENGRRLEENGKDIIAKIEKLGEKFDQALRGPK